VEAGGVDDHSPVRFRETACRLTGMFGCIFDNRHAAESAFARRQAHNRPLRIGVDDRGRPAGEVPMDRQAASDGALAAAALHRCHGDDRARHKLSP
jgi:hypothetical protein